MARPKLESGFQKHVIDSVGLLLPGSLVLKNDSSYLQGVPDLSIFYEQNWGMLEVKRSIRESYEPNQEYYIAKFNAMSFCAMICPENEEEVLHALQSALRARRPARISQR